MAIVQISQITNRKGLSSNLPQLAGAELGWSTDTRQLWIGNGTLEDGAPVVGNTEILTQFSDILNFTNTYTYQGAAAGYTVQTGPTAGTPVTQSLQSWLDQYASVLDFGAVGDGVTDCTEAINRALYQLYCREINPQIRRSLFFPAGVYRVSGSINIPPYATLCGEGNNNSLIAMDVGVLDYVARTADSLQNTGVEIGNAGAVPPQYITITDMGFTQSDPTGSVFLVEDATNCRFQNVGFRGTSTTSNLLTDSNGSIGVGFASTNSLICEQITFDGCVFSGLVWGVNTNQQTKAVTVTNSQFDTLYRGVVLGTTTTNNGGPTGTRIVGNMFDNIYAEGIVFGAYLTLGINASAHNIFYDVGNHFTGSTGTPATSIISILSNNNVSISDLFERTNTYATTYPRIDLNNTVSIATTNGSQINLGQYVIQSALISNVAPGTGTITTTNSATSFIMDYTVTSNSGNTRIGQLMVAGNVSNDSNVASGVTNVVLTGSANPVTINWNNTGNAAATLKYSISYFAD